MARVTLEVPRILRDCTEGQGKVGLEAERLDIATEEIRRRWPLLAAHIFDEAGDVRPHVLLFHNDQLTRGLTPLDVPLTAGDRLTIVQAVSGG